VGIRSAREREREVEDAEWWERQRVESGKRIYEARK